MSNQFHGDLTSSFGLEGSGFFGFSEVSISISTGPIPACLPKLYTFFLIHKEQPGDSRRERRRNTSLPRSYWTSGTPSRALATRARTKNKSDKRLTYLPTSG